MSVSISGTGPQQLAAASSFGDEDRLRLPFNVQRSHLFLCVVAAVAMLATAVAAGLSPLVGVGIVLAAAVAFTVALNEMVGLVLLATLAASTSGLAKGMPIPGVRLSQAVIGGVGIILLISARRFVRWAPLDWLALLYCVGTLVLGGWDMISLGQPFGLGTMELLLGPVQFLLLYRVTLIACRTPERRRLALRLMLLASIPVSLLALGQQFNAPGIRSLIVTLTKNDVYGQGGATARVTGPFPLWHNLGGYLVLLLLALLGLHLRRVEGVLSRRWMLIVGLIDLAALIETLDLAPMAGLLAGAIILGVWLGGMNRILIGLAVALAIGFLAFGSRLDARFGQQFNQAPGAQRSSLVPQTIQYRFDLWTNEELPLLKGHEITGWGPNLPPQMANFPYTESQYINLLYRGGIVLLVIWGGMFVAMGFAGVRANRDSDPFQRALGPVVAVSVLVLVFMQILEAYFVDDGTPQVLWMLLGLLAFHQAPSLRRAGAGAAATDPLLRRAWAANVALARDALDPSTEQLLALAYRDGRRPAEIAHRMGLTEPAVDRWRHSALERLALHANMPVQDVERTLREPAAWSAPAGPSAPRMVHA